MNEYEERLCEALKELDIVHSNSAIKWVRTAAVAGWNAILESMKKDGENHDEFWKKFYGGDL